MSILRPRIYVTGTRCLKPQRGIWVRGRLKMEVKGAGGASPHVEQSSPGLGRTGGRGVMTHPWCCAACRAVSSLRGPLGPAVGSGHVRITKSLTNLKGSLFKKTKQKPPNHFHLVAVSQLTMELFFKNAEVPSGAIIESFSAKDSVTPPPSPLPRGSHSGLCPFQCVWLSGAFRRLGCGFLEDIGHVLSAVGDLARVGRTIACTE